MIIGIDPGLTGAIAFIDGLKVWVYDTPTVSVEKGKKAKDEYFPSLMADILSEGEYKESHCFIEKVHSMPKQGVASSFNFGVGYGLWVGMLTAMSITYSEVTPQAWKKAMMAGFQNKDDARIRAQQLFPSLSKELVRKKDMGRADALLIAEYGRRLLSK